MLIPLSKLDHYRTHMKIYGSMIMYMAESDEEVRKIIVGDDLDGLLVALRERIERSPNHE